MSELENKVSDGRFEFKLTPAYCLYNGAAVLEQDGVTVKFLIENPEDEILKGRLQRAFQHHIESVLKFKDCPEVYRNLPHIEFVQGTRIQLRKCVSQLYRAEENKVKEKAEFEIAKSKREAAAVILLDSILNEARIRKATDIHIEGNCVRLRTEGRLEKLLELQEEKVLELIQRIKLLAGMNLIEKRRCQDGHFVYGNRNPFFLRVSTMNVIGKKYSGEEAVVIRLLDTEKIPLSIEALGFNLGQIEKLEKLLELKNGLVLVTGPTGAGKSTTVASLLLELEKKSGNSLKIISLEDPPEYVIPGVTQVKVDAQNSFDDALNHIFRQDPDVIMIGEIRDEKSAAAAIRASLTGHLVFATLHTAGAGESFLRLENLGVERWVLSSIIKGVVCQELNFIEGAMRLYADIALPRDEMRKYEITWKSLYEIDELFKHFTNYSDRIHDTVNALNRKKTGVKKIPLYRSEKNDERIHKRII